MKQAVLNTDNKNMKGDLYSLMHNGVQVEYRLLRSKRNRHLRLTVSSSTGVRVSGPRNCSDAIMHSLVQEKIDWIIHRLREYEQQRREQPRIDFREGGTIPLHGEDLQLKMAYWSKRKARIRQVEETLYIDLPPGIPDDHTVIRSLCEVWLRRYAQEYLKNRCRELAVAMRVMPTQIGVRRQKSKWGSCSARGSLSLNILLVCLPTEISDYVLIHELVHLREMNHSRKFWELVSEHCPDYSVQRRRLREANWLLEAWEGD